jgi:endonuclease YncB( thermonuclease family)
MPRRPSQSLASLVGGPAAGRTAATWILARPHGRCLPPWSRVADHLDMRISLALVVALLLALIPAASARAWTGRCFAGQIGAPCQFQTAKVVSVNDGDTVNVDVDGDHSRRIDAIRFRAVQAMELTRYSNDHSRWRGQCHAVAAAERVAQLVRGSHNRVRLSSQHPSSDHIGRLVRWIAVRRNGSWQDVGEILMREGHTLWMDNTSDTAWNRRYDELGQQAARAHRNLWNPTTCGAGPQQQVAIRLWVLSDPPRWDTAAGEWVKIQNRSATETLHLGRWWLRDAMLRRFTFPAGTDVAPGATLTLHVGPRMSSASDFYWAQAAPVFENSADAGDVGDGAYLFDPEGDLRAWMVYPCLVACSDPNQGALAMRAQPRGPERVEVTNRRDQPVDLYGYALTLNSAQFAFRQGDVLQPGETMTLYVQGDPADDSRDVRYLGVKGLLLGDSGGSTSVSTFNAIKLACVSWGSGRC